MNRKWLWTGIAFAFILSCLVFMAAVPGVFSNIALSGASIVPNGATMCGSGAGNYFDSACPGVIFGSGAPSSGLCTISTVNQQYVNLTGPYTSYYCKAISGPSYVWEGPFGGGLNYQTVQANGTNQPAEPALNFSTAFSLVDNPSVSTNVTLANVGTVGTVSYPVSIQFNAFGQETAWTAGTVIPRTCNSNGCYSEGQDGVIHEWAQVSSVPTGTGSNFPLPFTFPTACEGVNATDNGGSAIGANPRTIGSGCVSTSQIFLIASGTPSGTVFFEATGH